MYEHFEHTADLGLRVRSPNLNTLFAEAAEALVAAMVDDIASIEPRDQIELHVAGGELDLLLFDWLKEILVRFELDRMVFARFQVDVTSKGLAALAWGEPFDPERHHLSHEVKAITYHGLRVEQSDTGWLAEVIVDI